MTALLEYQNNTKYTQKKTERDMLRDHRIPHPCSILKMTEGKTDRVQYGITNYDDS